MDPTIIVAVITAIGVIAAAAVALFKRERLVPATPGTFDVNAVVDQLVRTHERELTGYREREQAYKDQLRGLEEALKSLLKQRQQVKSPPQLEGSLQQLQRGDTAPAEQLFQEVLDRKSTEGDCSA